MIRTKSNRLDATTRSDAQYKWRATYRAQRFVRRFGVNQVNCVDCAKEERFKEFLRQLACRMLPQEGVSSVTWADTAQCTPEAFTLRTQDVPPQAKPAAQKRSRKRTRGYFFDECGPSL
jgi:hypothetical protein